MGPLMGGAGHSKVLKKIVLTAQKFFLLKKQLPRLAVANPMTMFSSFKLKFLYFVIVFFQNNPWLSHVALVNE